MQHVRRQQDTVNEVQDAIHRLVVTAHHSCEVIEIYAALGGKARARGGGAGIE